MTMISAIEASVRRRGWAAPTEILADIGAQDMDDRETACALLVEMVGEGRIEAREIRTQGYRIPVFGWVFTRTAHGALGSMARERGAS